MAYFCRLEYENWTFRLLPRIVAIAEWFIEADIARPYFAHDLLSKLAHGLALSLAYGSGRRVRPSRRCECGAPLVALRSAELIAMQQNEAAHLPVDAHEKHMLPDDARIGSSGALTLIEMRAETNRGRQRNATEVGFLCLATSLDFYSLIGSVRTRKRA